MKRTRRGYTVPEILVAMALFGILALGAAWLIRSMARHSMVIQRRQPVHRDLQTAFAVVTTDLTSGVRSSLGNLLPDPGFERFPRSLSTSPTVPPSLGGITFNPLLYSTAHIWHTPQLFNIVSSFSANNTCALISSDDPDVFHGQSVLKIRLPGNYDTVPGRGGDYVVSGPTVTLNAGTRYVLAGWIRSPSNQTVTLALTDAPLTGAATLASVTGTQANWTYLTVLAPAGLSGEHRVRIVANETLANANEVEYFFDDVTLTSSGTLADLTSAAGDTFEFDRFAVAPPDVTVSVRQRIRYQVVRENGGDTLVRSRRDADGVFRRTGAFRGVQRLTLSWAPGQGDAGAVGANRPVWVRLVGAQTEADRLYSVDTQIHPVNP